LLTQREFLEPLARRRSDEVVITTMSLVRAWGELSSHPLDFAFADSAMGHSASLAFGLALARPERRVWCLNGDGSMLMSLGSLATIAQHRPANLVLFIAQNGTYEVTGNQSVPGAGMVDFAGTARACGWPHAAHFSSPREFEGRLDALLEMRGPVLVSVALERGHEPPPNRRESEDARYLRGSLADSVRELKQVLSSPYAPPRP
jgi:thiamine pyrophosphate-dependent acetolactate synthase large subunit-like protein